MNAKNVIAIDGASGTGKSTISKLLASNMNLNYIDTGAIYRGVALSIKKDNIDLNDEEKLKNICEKMPLSFKFIGEQNHVFLDNKDISNEIRTQEISMMASKVSAIPIVRKSLVDIQHRLAKETDKKATVVDGRDMGTVIFPNAKVKLFLTAKDKIRAERRFKELKQRGMDVDFETVLKQTIKRDKDDSERKIAPLKKASDAIEVNTDNLSINEVFMKIKEIIKEKINLC